MHTITVIEIGTGETDELPSSVCEKLKQSDCVVVRASDASVMNKLEAAGIIFDKADYLLEGNSDDREIITDMIAKAGSHPITFAVPGHLGFSGEIVKELVERYEKVEIFEHSSFIERLFNSVRIDPLEGAQMLSSIELNQDNIQTGQHVFVMQVLTALRAEKVKAVLMGKYPVDHQIAVIKAPGSRPETLDWMPLHELDRNDGEVSLRSLYIPPLEQDEQVTSLSTLQHYIDRVTAPDGDVWINEQTPYSLIRYLKEETSELVEAIKKEDTDNWMEELGDVLVQILYQTNAAEKAGLFSFEDVLTYVNRKMRRRHPHVFDGVDANTPEQVDAIWQKIKQEEKRMKDET